MGHAVGAELHLCESFADFPDVTEQIVARCREQDGVAPTIIPAGGTNAIGALGFVNAALELAEQLRPDVIYIPMGTGGTYAGLLVGFLLAGLTPRIEAVRVVEPEFRNETHIKALCDELCQMLGLDERILPEEIIIRDEFFGDGYGFPTPEGTAAVELFQSLENVYLETTYTGKTVAALEHDLRVGDLDGETTLYWNTLNSRDVSVTIDSIDFRDLPPEFHAYFE